MAEREQYKVREYPLYVETTADRDTFYSKGWHLAEDFLEPFRFEADSLDLDDTSGYQASDVRYEVWRVVPDPWGGSAGFFHKAQLGTRGAFPVTVVYT